MVKLSCSYHGQEAKRDRGAQDKGITLMTSFLQLDHTSQTFHFLPIMPWNFKSISGLIHKLGIVLMIWSPLNN